MNARNIVPIIDLDNQKTRWIHQQADALRQACENTGFFLVTNHGVAKRTIDACLKSAFYFFQQPLAQKQRASKKNPQDPYGFSYLGEETLAHSRGISTPRDLKESFSMGPVVTRSTPADESEVAFAQAPNIWPDNPHDFREHFESYYRAMTQLSKILMERFAIALMLPADYFQPFISNPISALRANYYPSLHSKPLPKQLRAGEHSDYGTLTILVQSGCPEGLEIMDRTGTWIPIHRDRSALVVNIGDLLARWTNDRWTSSLHRVVIPNKGELSSAIKPRLSLTYFHQPNWDAKISCLPSCLQEGQQPIYKDVTSGQYLMRKFNATIQ